MKLIRAFVAALVVIVLSSGADNSVGISFAQSGDPTLVAHWTLDEVTGTTAADSSPSGIDGTLVNMDPAADWVPGNILGALDFDGIDDHVVIPYDPSLNYSSWIGATVTGWAKAQRLNHPDEQTLYGQWNGSSSN